MSRTGIHFVYVMATIDGGVPVAPCKIGVSHNPNVRLASVQTGSHKRLEVISAVPMPTRELADALEKGLHDHFGGYRMSGEWFDVSPIDATIGACCWAELIFKELNFTPDQLDQILSELGITDIMNKASDFIDHCRARGLPLKSKVAEGRR